MTPPNPPLLYTYTDSPVGRLMLAGDGGSLQYVSFPAGKRARRPLDSWRRDDALFGEAIRQLRAYFAGELTAFELPLELNGTAFQKSVWKALRNIPYGQTCSYGELAERIGRPTASRAVGAANGANPLPIIVPCHRVIGANGALTGFGGGVETKALLLRHEQRVQRLNTRPDRRY